MSTPTVPPGLTVLSLGGLSLGLLAGTVLTAVWIDGGGVRGYSSLLILRTIMLEIKRVNNLQEIPKPCDYFDLVAGTSTGGLIAIMLGRLRMDVDSCILKYQKMSGDIFKRGWQFPGKDIIFAYFKMPWFSEEKLKNSIQSVVETMISPQEKSLLEAQGVKFAEARLSDPGVVPGAATCNVFVCAVKVDDLTTTLLRTYAQPNGETETCAIWEAGRATSAAPLYFPTMKLKTGPTGTETEFFDGGMKNNNPIDEVKDEVFLRYRVEKPRCVVSIGTGYLAKATGDRGFWTKLGLWASGGYGFVGWTLLQLATNTQSKHLEIMREAKYADFRENYVRLNVEGGLANIGIERWDKMEDMRHMTEVYLATAEAKADIARCVERLGRGRDTKG